MREEGSLSSVTDAAEKIVEQALLYDFYGELLTEHQRQIYEDFVCNNLSLSEIAQERQVSRQSVHDSIKRSDRLLEDYESRLHLVSRFRVMKKKIAQIHELACSQKGAAQSHIFEEIKTLSQELMENL